MLVISGDDDSVLAAAADNKHLLVFEVLPDHPERRPHVLLLPRAQLAVSAETPGKAMTGLSHSVTHGGPTRHLDDKDVKCKLRRLCGQTVYLETLDIFHVSSLNQGWHSGVILLLSETKSAIFLPSQGVNLTSKRLVDYT